MITCNRCGNMSPAGAMNCQTCGAPLSSKVDTGFGPSRGMSPQDQPELPAWLESLRVGERPAANDVSEFSAADLIEEGTLPSWMRSGRPDMSEAGVSGAFSLMQPSSAPGPNTDDSRSINASSLIDEQALPSWMQENQAAPQMSGNAGAAGIPASSLVQSDFVPDWMKSLQSQQPPAASPVSPARPAPPANPASPVRPAAFSPRETPPMQPGGMGDFTAQPAAGFSARDLVDPQSLPQWMAPQQQKDVAPTSSGPGSLSPSSLLDMDSLPAWMREGGQGPQGQRGGAPTNQPQQASSMPVEQYMSNMQPAAQQPQPLGNSVSASSFIDPSALPEWLRTGAQPGGAAPAYGGSMPNPRGAYGVPGTPGVPPRVENMRVPSRPRGEINPNEGNEAAANAFASMLGVASASPQYPMQPAPGPGYGMPQGMSPTGNLGGMGFPGQSGQLGQPGFPGQSGQLGQPGFPGQSGQLGQPGFPGQSGQLGQPGLQPQQGYAAGGYGSGAYQQPAQNNPMGQGNYGMGNSANVPSPYSPGAFGMVPGQNAMRTPGMEAAGEERSGAKAAKKGFFETIRDWFR